MRRFLPHLLVIFVSLASIAVLWHVEPDITFLPRPQSRLFKPDAASRDYFVRLESKQELDLTELTVKITWDKSKLKAPRIWHAPLSRHMKPRAKIFGNELTITFHPTPRFTKRLKQKGKVPALHGKGRLARIGFRRVRQNQPLDMSAVTIRDAAGVRLGGAEISSLGLVLVEYKPTERPIVKKPASSNEEINS